MNFAETDYDALEASGLLNEEHIMKEIQAFTLASHFFWSLWGIVNAQVSKIPFGYWVNAPLNINKFFFLTFVLYSLIKCVFIWFIGVRPLPFRNLFHAEKGVRLNG